MRFYFYGLIYDKKIKQLKASHGESWGNTELPSLAEQREMLKQLETNLVNSELKRDSVERKINEISAFAKKLYLNKDEIEFYHYCSMCNNTAISYLVISHLS